MKVVVLIDLLIFSGVFALLLLLYMAYPKALEWKNNKAEEEPPKNCPFCQFPVQADTSKCPQCHEWIDPSIRLLASGTLLLSISMLCVTFLWDIHLRIIPIFHGMLAGMGGKLPTFSIMVYSMGYTLITTVTMCTLNAFAITYSKKISTKNKLLGLSCAVGVLSILLQIYALYMPIFQLAGNVTK